ncbi:hypothetical protein D3C86_1573210 [compost metagenome]
MQIYCSCYLLLAMGKEGFNIPHHRVQNLALMQPVGIKLCQCIFPLQLPFGKHMFFQCMMRFQNDHRSRGFKSYTPFDPDNSIPDMYISAYGICPGNTLHCFDCICRMWKFYPVNGLQFSLFKMQA